MRLLYTAVAAPLAAFCLLQQPSAATPNRIDAAKVQQRKAAMQSEVEVDMYSGRENPRFVLGDGETAELERRIAALPPLRTNSRPRNGLGYRGLLVRDSNSFADLVISDGTVEIRDRSGRITRRSDPGRELERWLIEAGAEHLQPGELDSVRNDLRQ